MRRTRLFSGVSACSEIAKEDQSNDWNNQIHSAKRDFYLAFVKMGAKQETKKQQDILCLDYGVVTAAHTAG